MKITTDIPLDFGYNPSKIGDSSPIITSLTPAAPTLPAVVGVVPVSEKLEVEKIPLKKLLKRQQDDVTTLVEHQSRWFDEAIEDDMQQCPEWREYEDKLYALDKKANTDAALRKKDKAAMAKKVSDIQDSIVAKTKGEISSEMDEALSYWRKYMSKHEIYYVARQASYFEYDNKSHEWMGPFKEHALKKSLRAEGDIMGPAFEQVMDERGAQFKEQTNTFREVNADTLNRMRTDHWLKPERADGKPHHWMFDVLIQSIGNSNQDAMDYIESWISFKYRIPAEYKLPALILYGTEGTGKNTLVDDVLTTVFGDHQCRKVSTEEAFGKFNAMLSGNVITFVDEPDELNKYRGKVYTTLNNKRFNVELKGVDPYTVDATSAFIMSGNDKSATVFLNDRSSNRRFSPIKGTRDCYTILQEHYNAQILEAGGTDEDLITREEAGDMWDANDTVFTDPLEVTRWLAYIINKHQSDERPVAFRDEFYNEIVNSNKDMLTLVLEGIFLDPDFRNVSWETLWECYQIAYSKAHSRNMRYAKQYPAFELEVSNWLRENDTAGITNRTVKIRNPTNNNRTTSRREFVALGVGVAYGDTIFKTDREYYTGSFGGKIERLEFELGASQWIPITDMTLVDELDDLQENKTVKKSAGQLELLIEATDADDASIVERDIKKAEWMERQREAKKQSSK